MKLLFCELEKDVTISRYGDGVSDVIDFFH